MGSVRGAARKGGPYRDHTAMLHRAPNTRADPYAMTRLVDIELPASFIVQRVLPTGAEVAYGFQEGWLSRNAVIAIELAKYEAGLSLSSAEEELALLLSDDVDRVDELVRNLEISDEPTERRARLWLYLALAWLLDHRSDYDDVLEVIEMLYADFDYPEEIRSLVRFMPPGPGDRPGVEGIEQRWRDFVDRVGREYLERV